jgi:hypothetical protein
MSGAVPLYVFGHAGPENSQGTPAEARVVEACCFKHRRKSAKAEVLVLEASAANNKPTRSAFDIEWPA